ncbi:HAD family hydrolase [Levilactobacillus tangyuanensis]|uniref:HAD family hydrolase n=1 Tax=Levilactobacillus tangyuanensis TaxID=2486021 RepID=A0ABW1TLL2_9LACO|nr:HAD family hydrolase [Levilactobacillus tangyuanensis]
MTQTKYLTFDCYGTLLNEDGTYDEIAKLATKIGVDPQLARQRFIAYQDDRDNVHPYLDYDLLTRNNLIHLDYQFGLKHQFERYYPEVLLAHRDLKPFPEVLDTLKALQAKGYHLIMMSNSSWDIIPFNAATLQVPFDIWPAEDVHAYKPDLDFFQTVADHYGLTSENHWHIAQGYDTDILATDPLGWPTIWVNRSGMKPTAAARPTHEVSTLDQVLQWL